MPKYKSEQINIGDEITYKNRREQSGYTTGKVIAKLDRSILLITKKEKQYSENRMIETSEITSLISFHNTL